MANSTVYSRPLPSSLDGVESSAWNFTSYVVRRGWGPPLRERGAPPGAYKSLKSSDLRDNPLPVQRGRVQEMTDVFAVVRDALVYEPEPFVDEVFDEAYWSGAIRKKCG